jgi:hypothetical protein
LIGQLFTILLLAATLALPVSLGLLKLYRRAVLRSMRTQTDLQATEFETLGVPAQPTQPIQKALDLTFLNQDSPTRAGREAEALYSNLRYAPWRAAALQAVAGFCYAFALAPAFFASQEIDLLLPRLLMVSWTFAWPVVLTVNLMAATNWRARFAIVFIYFYVLVTLVAITPTSNPTVIWGYMVTGWTGANYLATLLLLAFLTRRVRAVGPLVLTFMLFAVTGSMLALFTVHSNAVHGSGNLLDLILALGSVLGWRVYGFLMGPIGSTLASILGGNAYGVAIGFFGILDWLIVLGLAVFGLTGWLGLRWIGGRYERKKISDQSITLDAIWLMFGIVYSLYMGLEGVGWILAGLLAFVVYKTVARVEFSLLGNRDRAVKSTNLLLLRVFSLGKRSERLFDALAKHWRHIGSIRLIAGPDLATTTIEPHEFLDFLSGKLARRFIDGPKTLELRISEMDLKPDQDGRFRVNDFFCHEDTWQMTLSCLVDDSDVVLMDLRSFSAQNEGVVYEIDELINVVPLGRVVFVIDDTTDEQFLRQTVQESWVQMRPTSPNRSSTSGELRLFRFSGSHGGGELQRLLRTLCAAAETAPPTAVGS